MRASQPPRVATWLLKHFGCSPNNEAVLGDLVEQYRQRQSRIWFWKQVLIALASGFYEDALSNKLLMLRAIFFGWCGWVIFYLFVLQMASVWIYWRVFGIVPSPSVVNGQITYFPPSPWWTSYPGLMQIGVLLCAAITGSIAAQVGREHRRAAVLSYAVTVAVLIVPGVLSNLLDPPHNAHWQFWNAQLFALFHIPSILLGGLVGGKRRTA